MWTFDPLFRCDVSVIVIFHISACNLWHWLILGFIEIRVCIKMSLDMTKHQESTNKLGDIFLTFPEQDPTRSNDHHMTRRHFAQAPLLAGHRPAAALVPRSSPAPRRCGPGRRSPHASLSPGRGVVGGVSGGLLFGFSGDL